MIPLDLEHAARLSGAYRWIEQRLFEMTGAWSGDPGDPAVQLFFFEHSRQHAWHAELWADRLPVLDGIDHAALTRPPSEAVEQMLASIADLGPDPAVARLAGLCRVVLPRLIVSYEVHLERTAPGVDGPTRRALRLVRRDEIDQWLAGERLVQELLVHHGPPARAVAVVGELEQGIVRAGLGPGLLHRPVGDAE